MKNKIPTRCLILSARLLFYKRSLCLLFFLQLFSLAAFSQLFTITGKVKNSKSEPLAGVSINLKGSSIGVSSDSTGIYSIHVPGGSGTLIFSFVGMKTEEIVISGRGVIMRSYRMILMH